jgi:hypothetical protein
VQKNEIPNILLLGIDSASSLNFERQCHKTMNLLKEQIFYRLNVYTRISDNRFPNMVPFYAANFTHELYSETLNYKTFNDWPFIWKVNVNLMNK